MHEAYAAAADRLRSPPSPASVTALPDGSIDTYYRVLDRRGGRVTSRAQFGERILGAESESVPVERSATDLGGQSVNAARQVAALGDDVAVLGFLDDPRFDALDAETVSLGTPASVSVYEFSDLDLLLAETPPAMADCTFDDLRAAAGDDLTSLLGADAIFWGNWVSFEHVTDLADRVADHDGGVLVVDPGDVTTRPEADVAAMVDSLDALGAGYDVVVSINRAEATCTARARGVASATDAATLRALREDAGVRGVVLHDRSQAVAATPEGVLDVPTLTVSDPARRTGGGDRFGAGLAHALARDWSWPSALAIGNLCGSAFVEHGETRTRSELVDFLETHA